MNQYIKIKKINLQLSHISPNYSYEDNKLLIVRLCLIKVNRYRRTKVYDILQIHFKHDLDFQVAILLTWSDEKIKEIIESCIEYGY